MWSAKIPVKSRKEVEPCFLPSETFDHTPESGKISHYLRVYCGKGHAEKSPTTILAFLTSCIPLTDTPLPRP